MPCTYNRDLSCPPNCTGSNCLRGFRHGLMQDVKRAAYDAKVREMQAADASPRTDHTKEVPS